MKAILISVRPKWVGLILSYIKKDEIRKGSSLYKAINKLIKEQGIAPMFIYCTKEKKTNKWAKRNVLCSDVHNGKPSGHYQLWLKDIDDGLHTILNGKVVARFNATVDLLELKMIEGGLFFAKPDKEVVELDLNENAQIDNFELLRYTGYKLGTQISDIHINDLKIFDKPKELKEFKTIHKRFCEHCPTYTCMAKFHRKWCYKPLTRAPQSYCYVEVENENFN